jgi:hypothetical protein
MNILHTTPPHALAPRVLAFAVSLVLTTVLVAGFAYVTAQVRPGLGMPLPKGIIDVIMLG